MNISGALIGWYQENKRDLPWRHTRDPYLIWLSEIILQQTRVEQGLPYYLRFTTAFPTVIKLAKADENQILKLWQGLGYYSRARNLHKAAKIIVEDYAGVFPSDYQTIIKLPGIGEYTAAAITSFAWNMPYAVVDGNVNRFISRVFGIEEPINSTKGQKIFRETAAGLLSPENAGLHNQAIMEFGALHCKPQSPDCPDCPFATICVARKKGLVAELPVKLKKVRIRIRQFIYLLIRQGDHTFIRQRKNSGIWQNLFELPYIETEPDTDPASIIDSPEWHHHFGKHEITVVRIGDSGIHKLTHQHLHLKLIEVKIHGTGLFRTSDRDLQKISAQDVDHYPVPKPVEHIFKEYFPEYQRLQ